MRRWLMLTTVDPQVRPNNREHNLLCHLARRFDEVDVVFRRSCPPGTRADSVRNALVYHSTVTRIGNVNYVAVNPLLNHHEGMIRDAIGVSREQKGRTIVSTASRLAYSLIGPVGIAKDMLTVGCLAAAARARLRRGGSITCTALGPWAAAAAWLLRRSGAIPHFIYEDRDYEPGFVDSGLRKAWVHQIENRMMRSADEVITVGHRLRELRRRETGREPILIPSGADRIGFAARPCERRAILVYTGKLARWAGLTRVIEALPEVAEVIPDVRLRIVGTGPQEVVWDLEDAIRRSGTEKRVEILGSRPHAEIAALLDDAMIGLATFEPIELRVYAMPLKVVEYMAAGLPVLGTAHTETADVIHANKCGMTAPLEPRALAKAIIALLTDRERWSMMSANAVAGSARFDWTSLLELEWDVMQRVFRTSLSP